MNRDSIPSLDGLRAVAVAIVFGGHLVPWIPGEFGVTVFFFLSGYLITTLLRMEFDRHGAISLKAFYLRRALRIFPPFYLVFIGVTVLAALGWLGTTTFTLPGLLSEAAYGTNYYLASGEWFPGIPFGGAPGTGVYWSLAVEEHFYLFFPLLYIVLRHRLPDRRRQALLLAAICALILVWRCFLVFGLHSGRMRTYVATDSRIDSILFGCILAIVANPFLERTSQSEANWKWLWLPLGLVGLLAGFVIHTQSLHETFRYTLQGICLVPVFVVAVRYPDWWLMRPLNWGWMRFAGVLSYSIYLLHATVIGAVETDLSGQRLLVKAVVALAITVGLAYAIHRLVELPCARLRRHLSRLRQVEPRTQPSAAAVSA